MKYTNKLVFASCLLFLVGCGSDSSYDLSDSGGADIEFPVPEEPQDPDDSKEPDDSTDPDDSQERPSDMRTNLLGLWTTCKDGVHYWIAMDHEYMVIQKEFYEEETCDIHTDNPIPFPTASGFSEEDDDSSTFAPIPTPTRYESMAGYYVTESAVAESGLPSLYIDVMGSNHTPSALRRDERRFISIAHVSDNDDLIMGSNLVEDFCDYKSPTKFIRFKERFDEKYGSVSTEKRFVDYGTSKRLYWKDCSGTAQLDFELTLSKSSAWDDIMLRARLAELKEFPGGDVLMERLIDLQGLEILGVKLPFINIDYIYKTGSDVVGDLLKFNIIGAVRRVANEAIYFTQGAVNTLTLGIVPRLRDFVESITGEIGVLDIIEPRDYDLLELREPVELPDELQGDEAMEDEYGQYEDGQYEDSQFDDGEFEEDQLEDSEPEDEPGFIQRLLRRFSFR